ncbi:Putative metal chaperone YciC [Paenibacillus polymyxa E681]|uniref:CobW family GTP-binding protein n=1 Tax=Paenibacillus polymyxa TaxID=1406 RepID=UPI0001E3181F|nr:CobW family GTP-binding protein [Paenibacillus polymyxa]ADM69964.1 GTPase [Paenibacillus polymyxa E681]QNV56989.1 Putative metal chaperone YciC [Paenibacillus polymyxa E681]QNV61826.1 Putative metal chaperone YciC [Paenibacillus polymyxa E681]
MIPIVVLSGFLGSGKTTLLQHALAYYKEKGFKPAILMNELGDVNLDGSLVNDQAPMKEMLSGCICCTIRGDLGVELMNLAEEYKPDVIIVECTGVANPMEIVDAVTDASIYSSIILQSVITVIDARQFLDFASGNERSKSLRLMQDQLRCASKLIINKTDLLTAGELQKAQALVKELNPYALSVSTQRSDVDAGIFFSTQVEEPMDVSRQKESAVDIESKHPHSENHLHTYDHDNHTDHQSHDHHDHVHDHEHGEHYHSYDHVVVHTHFFGQPVPRSEFEQLFRSLPAEIYRAKGIVRFLESEGQMMFQFAYRELEIIPIRPQKPVNDVAVVMGENFSASEIEGQLRKLETAEKPLSSS